MASKLALLGVSSIAVGATGVSTYMLYDNSKSFKKLKDLFDNTQGRILLDAVGNKHDSVGAQLFEEHNKASNKIEGVDSKEKLKDYCRDKAESVDSNDLEIYSNWCSRNTLRTQINTLVSKKTWIDGQDDASGTPNKTAYSQQTPTEILIPKEDASGDIAKNELTGEQLRNFCNSKKTEPFINDKDGTYIKVVQWCTSSSS